ncbi:MAG: hypothetical protein ABSG56_27575, partial [Bryobacteraceae bacterium]
WDVRDREVPHNTGRRSADARRAGGAASAIGAVSVGGGRIVHRDAEAQPGTATPVRAVAPADSFWLPELGGVTRIAPPALPRPWSVAATAGRADGMRAAWRAPASMIGAGPTGEGRAICQARRIHERPARGHLTGTPTRSRHARGGGATERLPPARSGARRPWSVAATAGGRMGMRAAAGHRRPWLARSRPADGVRFRSCRDPPGTSTAGHFAGMPTFSLHARGAGNAARYFRVMQPKPG